MVAHSDTDSCPTCGWRRDYVQVDGMTMTVCPYCADKQLVP